MLLTEWLVSSAAGGDAHPDAAAAGEVDDHC